MNIAMTQEAMSNYYTQRVSGILRIPILVRWTTAIFLLSQVCYGPFRFFMAKFGLQGFVYFPKTLLLIMILFMFLTMRRVSKIFVIGITIIVLSTAWAMVDLPSVEQSLFGVWIIIPLLYGLLFSRHLFDDMAAYKSIFFIFLVITLAGVFINIFVHYPWTGATFQINGETIYIARQWWALGINRIGGFSAASFDAAMQIIFFMVWLMFALKSELIKFLLWMISGLAITMTTTKGIVGAYIILSFFFASGRLFNHNLIWRQCWTFIIGINVCALLLMPLSTIFIHYDPVVRGYVDRFIFASFGDRLNYTWPASFNLLHGVLRWMIGRGIGGIGTPQTYFEPTNALPADNLYVYLAVDLGPIAAAIMLVGIYVKISGTFLLKNNALMPLLIILFSYGMVSNIIEAPILSLALGIAIGKSFQSRRML